MHCGCNARASGPFWGRRSTFLPIAWLPTLMRNGQNGYHSGIVFVMDRVGKVPEDVVANSIFVFRPYAGLSREAVDRRENLRSEGLGCEPATFTVPKKSLAKLPLGVRRKRDVAGHSTFSRALTAAHGTAFTVPACKALRRLRTSSRQASEMEASGLPSRLSSKATTSADRSSVGNSRASSNK